MKWGAILLVIACFVHGFAGAADCDCTACLVCACNPFNNADRDTCERHAGCHLNDAGYCTGAYVCSAGGGADCDCTACKVCDCTEDFNSIDRDRCEARAGCFWYNDLNSPYPIFCSGRYVCPAGGGGGGETPSGTGGACFTGQTTVIVKEKGTVAMKDLQVGDQVMTGKGHYQPVYAFGHHQRGAVGDFLRIHVALDTKNSQDPYSVPPFEITGEHLIFLHGQAGPIRADALQVGDAISMLPSATSTQVARIIKITKITAKGLYAPLTADGTLVINGRLVASSYISLQDGNTGPAIKMQKGTTLPLSQHCLVHMALTPFRVYCMLSTGFCPELEEESGMPWFVEQGIQILQWLDQQSWILQALLFPLCVSTAGVMETMEYLLWNPAIGCFLGVIILSLYSQSIGCRHGHASKTL